MAFRRNASVQIGKRFGIVEPCAFWQERCEEIDGAIAFANEKIKVIARGLGLPAAVAGQEHRLAFGRLIARRQEGEGQIIGALEMRGASLETCAPFLIDEKGDRVRKGRRRVIIRRNTRRFKEERPARAKAFQHIVDAGGEGEKLRVARAFEIRPAITDRALETPILVEDNARRDNHRPGEIIGKALRTRLVFAQVQHERYALCFRCRSPTSRNFGSFFAA